MRTISRCYAWVMGSTRYVQSDQYGVCAYFIFLNVFVVQGARQMPHFPLVFDVSVKAFSVHRRCIDAALW